jgi:hypothetical protein
MAEPQELTANMLTELRASDVERAEVADLLTNHFMDGRLDRSEFDERLGVALKAKTRGELTALLHDLPRIVASRPVPLPPRHRAWTRIAPLAVICLFGFCMLAAASLIGRTGSPADAHAGLSGHSMVMSQHSPAFSLAPVLVVVILVASVCLAIRFFRHTHERR